MSKPAADIDRDSSAGLGMAQSISEADDDVSP